MNWLRRLKRYLMGDDMLSQRDREYLPTRMAAEEIQRRASSGEDIANTTLVSMSKEDTVKWLQGDPTPWTAHSQGEFRERVIAQNASLQHALYASVDLFIEAMRGHSEITAGRLMHLKRRAQEGDQRSTELMMVMLGELINQAFTEVH